jgi:hypothetical protein
LEEQNGSYSVLSHFFAHNFANTPDSQCQCGHRSQTTSHVFFTCPLLNNDVSRTSLTEIRSIPNFDVASFETLSLTERVYLLLHGGSDLATIINKAIVSKTADFSERVYLLLHLQSRDLVSVGPPSVLVSVMSPLCVT